MTKKVLMLLLLFSMLTGCAFAGAKATEQKSDTPAGKEKTETIADVGMTRDADRKEKEKEMTAAKLMIKVIANQNEIVFLLNDSSVARSFYAQLPLTVAAENYGNNEKVFQPPKKLDCSKAQEGACPVGTIAYFSPWNNVCLYYGDAPRYTGLYVMGKTVRGSELIRNISGKIKIEAYTNEK